MGMSTEQLVEFALIEAFPGQSQAEKGLFRFELESFVPQALSQLAQEVASSSDYQMLQRTVVVPILNSQEIEYNRFGSGVGGDEPVIDNGIVFGDSGAYALSPQRLSLSGSPLRVRSQFLEWQWLTVKNDASAGVIGFNPTEADIVDISLWKDAVRVGTAFSSGDVFANGVQYGNVFTMSPGDYLRFQWDANGDLTITQYDVNRTLVLAYVVTGGEVTAVSTPGVLFLGDGGQVGIGRIGTGTSTSLTPTQTDGLYRLDLGTDYQFLTSFFDETGVVQFEGTSTLLSWIPSLNYRGQASRCDTWYYTFEGEQIVLWPGEAGMALPANNLRIVGNIVPEPTDLPHEYHVRAIAKLVEWARQRAGMAAKSARGR